MKKRDKLKT